MSATHAERHRARVIEVRPVAGGLYKARVGLRYKDDEVACARGSEAQAKRAAMKLARKLGWVIT